MDMRGRNGGLADMPREQRSEIAFEAAAQRQERTTGWPKPVAMFGTPEYHDVTSAEMDRRFAKHEQRFHQTGAAPQVQDAGHILQWGN